MNNFQSHERLKKITKQILSEYLWVSKEKSLQKTSWGGSWEETEKG